MAQVAPSVASGLGPRILAAGPAHVRQYSDRGPLCEADPKRFDRARPRAHRPIPRQPPGPSARKLARAEALSETATREDGIENWDIRSLAIEPYHPAGAALRRRDPRTRDPPARAARSSKSISVHERTLHARRRGRRRPERRPQGGIAGRGQPAARSTARIRGWPSISSSSTTSTSSRPTMRPSRRRPSGEKPQ